MKSKFPVLSAVRKLIIVFILLNLSGCGGTRGSNNTANPEDFVWPLPPDPPKIKFVKSIHSEMDVGHKRSFVRRIYEAVFGRAPLRALKKPLVVHTDKSERILVVDSGWRKVLVFDFENNQLGVLGKSGRGRLLNPLGVTTDDNGQIYVADAGGQRIMIYDSEGKFLRAFGGKGILERPSGIAVNLKLGKIYVVDTWAHQIKVFDINSGNVLFTIGKKGEKTTNNIEGALDYTWNRGDGPGEFRFPTQITIGPDGKLYIVDTLNFRIQIITALGEFVNMFGEVGNIPGTFYRPKGIGLDSEGHIYVSDAAFNNIQIFDTDGNLLLNFGSFGSGLADLRLPAGMHINDMDKIFVVDQFNNRIQVYQYLGGEPKKEKDLITEKERR